ncbi:MAG: hypothetical protein HY259_03595 [Chloroflexi bacterium]|nr:hypothetical protein [Chloroflexota bacterium]MBI3732525.1 hypothetical protein [Chloroflexota bacterium]
MKTQLLLGLMGIVMAVVLTFGLTSSVLADPLKPYAGPKPAEQGKVPKVKGIVTAVQASVITVSTKEGDKTVVTSAQTVYSREKNPAILADVKIGNVIKATGTVGADGKFLATTVEIKMPEAEGPEVEGTVAKVDGAVISLTSKDGSTKMVVTNAQTTFRKADLPASVADVKVGDKVEAKGTLGGDGRLTAETLKVEAPKAPGQEKPHPEPHPEGKKTPRP